MKRRGKIEKVTEEGDTLESLKALRQKLAKTLDETTGGRDVASLALQLQKVLTTIDEMTVNTDGEPAGVAGHSKWKEGMK